MTPIYDQLSLFDFYHTPNILCDYRYENLRTGCFSICPFEEKDFQENWFTLGRSKLIQWNKSWQDKSDKSWSCFSNQTYLALYKTILYHCCYTILNIFSQSSRISLNPLMSVQHSVHCTLYILLYIPSVIKFMLLQRMQTQYVLL